MRKNQIGFHQGKCLSFCRRIILRIGGGNSANSPVSMDWRRESPAWPIINFFQNGDPSGQALFFSIGFFFYFLNAGRGNGGYLIFYEIFTARQRNFTTF
jgi:hypothetical protein